MHPVTFELSSRKYSNHSIVSDRGRFDRITSTRNRLRFGVFALSLLALAGCATAPKPLQGSFAPLTPNDAIARDATGASVRWGGTIAIVESLSGETCFQLVGRSLDDVARPTDSDRVEGRFIACRQGFYEPQVFAKGRSLTITGRVVGYETRKVGDYDYRQPKVAADVIYLWPKRRDVDVYYMPPPFEPWPRWRRW